jgi:hypothetical protein
LKRRQLVEFGYTDRNPAEFEEDHLVPLELAGAPQDPKNLWPQPWADARVKDQEENDLHIAVCQHRMALGDAQAKILADWGLVVSPLRSAVDGLTARPPRGQHPSSTQRS